MKCLIVFCSIILSIIGVSILPKTTLFPEQYSCDETWFDAGIDESVHSDKIHTRFNICRKGDRQVDTSTQYMVSDGNAYRVNIKKERYDPSCTYGGGPGNMGQIAIPICWLAQEKHRMKTDEHRTFWLVSRDGANFRTAPTKQSILTSSQKSLLSNYVVDSDSVYFISEKIKGADQKNFEVIFPFENIPHLQKYSIGRDSKQLYIDGWPFPLIDLAAVHWLKLSCSDDEYLKCADNEYRQPSLGVFESNLIYLDRWSHATLFYNFAKSDLVCSFKVTQVFCLSGGRRYMIKSNIFDDEVKLIPQS